MVPCTLPYDTIAGIHLYMSDLGYIRKGLREDSINVVERDSQGFGLALYLALMFSYD